MPGITSVVLKNPRGLEVVIHVDLQRFVVPCVPLCGMKEVMKPISVHSRTRTLDNLLKIEFEECQKYQRFF